MLRKRQPLLDWRRSELTWSTQFADLRSPTSLGKTALERERTTRRELKQQALFQICTVIRDADVVNNPTLLRLILDNTDSIQVSILNQMHVLAIRSDVGSFSELNELAGERRAHPRVYQTTKPLVKRLDALLFEKHAWIGEVERSTGKDTFRKLLERIWTSSHLSDSQKRLLQTAIERADSGSKERILRFGDIYSHLVRQKRLSPNSDLIQWCRAAHVLTVPAELHIAPSSADQDLEPACVAFVLGHETNALVDSTEWSHMFPRKILSDDALDCMTFDEIVRYRQLGDITGYFDSAQALTKAFNSPQREKAFIAYLKCLENYLVAIGAQAKVELVDWQRAVTNRYLKKEIRSEALCYAIPVIVTEVCSLLTHSPIPIGTATAVFTGLKTLRDLRRLRKPRPIERLLSGTTVTPPVRGYW
jgi:hypothetical protein